MLASLIPSPRLRRRPDGGRPGLLSLGLLLGLGAILATCRPAPASDDAGAKVYARKCASCHGAAGEGSEDCPRELAGDRSVPQLARVIARTMPEDDPGTCVGEEAEKVAAYIFDAFYSKSARERNRPPRVELSRLTVRQYRHAAADLVGTFRGDGHWGDKRGLKAEYFNSRDFRGDRRVFERVDPEVRFDFGEAGPEPEKFDPNEFSIRWQGSVLAPETGEYDFIVRTDHAARLWVNDPRRPLIDAWVKSGSDTEYRASIHLLGGRVYPLRLEFSKAKQGVADKKKDKKKNRKKKERDKKAEQDRKKKDEKAPDKEKDKDKDKDRQPDKAEKDQHKDKKDKGRESEKKADKDRDKKTSKDDDEEDEKPPGIKASIALEWTIPHRTASVVPQRALSPDWFPEGFVLTSAFPPDDRSVGYERGTTVSKAWDQATTEAAIEVADYVAVHLNELAGTRDDASDRPAKLRDFARRFAERAFRRPLDDELAKKYVARQFEAAADPETAVKRVVLLVLKSPRFLYREPEGRGDGFEVASRLAFGLWDSLPDRQLLDAAGGGRLATREQVAEQARRMAKDLRARAKLRDFLLQWLKVEHAPDIAKDPRLFPEFDAPVASDLRTSLELLLDEVIGGEAADFRQLLLDDQVYLNGRLARIYGVDLPADAPFRKVALEPSERAGVLSHPYLMAAFAYTATSSPIHRGVFIARGMLGRGLRPPPEAVAPLAPDLHPGLSTRERVALQTRPAACITCHGMINPLGFGLEHFDALGRFRREEKGKPVDASGSYEPPAGEPVKYRGARELATLLAASDETHAAFVEQLFHALVKQPARAYGPRTLADLKRSFTGHDYNIRSLAVEIMAASALPATPAKK